MSQTQTPAPKSAIVAVNTGRSIKNAATSAEVYQALVAHVTENNAITSIGDGYIKDCSVVVRPQGFLQSNGKVKFTCRTNKFLDSVQADLLAFRGKVLSMNVEDARKAAYALSDKHNIVLNIWEDAEELNAFLAGRPFTATVRQRSYVTKEGEQRTELFFHDPILQEVGAKGKTLSKDIFAFPDPSAQPESGNAEVEQEAGVEANALPAGN